MEWVLLVQLLLHGGGSPTSVEFESFDACKRSAKELRRVYRDNWRDTVSFCINNKTGETIYISRK